MARSAGIRWNGTFCQNRTQTPDTGASEPCRTAASHPISAFTRTAHQVLDHGSILYDPFAIKILREDEKVVLHYKPRHFPSRSGGTSSSVEACSGESPGFVMRSCRRSSGTFVPPSPTALPRKRRPSEKSISTSSAEGYRHSACCHRWSIFVLPSDGMIQTESMHSDQHATGISDREMDRDSRQGKQCDGTH